MFTQSLKYCFIISCFAISGITSYAQKYNYERKANQAAQQQDFYTAAVYYEKAIAVKKENIDSYKPYNGEVLEGKSLNKGKASSQQKLIFKLAEAHRQYNNFEAAAPWYAQAAQFTAPEFQSAKYWSAVCLRIKGDYTKAAPMLEEFLKVHTTKDNWTKLATTELANCKFAIEKQKQKELVKYQTNKLSAAVNDQSANYAPMLLSSDVLTFTSSRNTWSTNRGNIIPKNSNIESKTRVNDLFQVSVSKMNDTKQMNVPVVAMDQGVASFSADKTKLYLTRWKIENGKKLSNIYISTQQKDGKWSAPTTLNTNVNISGYSSKQPFVSSDGGFLFFSSDKPGGIGKFDLWVCTLGSDGLPTAQATNLGIVNTIEDEEAPFYHTPTDQLFFSSNGRVGFGGFDFYVSKGKIGYLTEPKNVGAPYNSSKDDVYFTSVADEPLSQAFISSDRSSTCCLEIFNINRQIQAWTISGKVFNCKDKNPLSTVSVTVKDKQNNGATIATLTSDQNGEYKTTYNEGQSFTLTFNKDSFYSKTIDFNPEIDRNTNKLTIPDVCLEPIEIKKAIILPEVQYDYDKATLRPESEQSLDGLVTIMKENPTLKIQMAAHTDSKGSDKYNQKLSEARAKSCVEYLVQHGIAMDRLTYKGFGAKKPIAPNTNPDGSDNPEGRQKNRRTEFSIQSL